MNQPFLHFPQIDPILFSLGPLQVRWYGLMYLLGFLFALWLGNRRADRPGSGWRREEVSDLLFYGFLGVILGGRLGYVLFYQFSRLLDDPLYLVRIWEGGMSFHGGLLGVIAALGWFAHKSGRHFLTVGDFIAPLVPFGLAAGRIGNFINAELWGRVTDLPWGIVFPGAGPLPRHPSQLYEFMLEGVALLLILLWFSRRPRPRGAVSGVFLLAYGTFRFVVEFAREPDAHLGTLALGMSMGQWLSLPMILLGCAFLGFAYRGPFTPGNQVKAK